MFAFSGNQEGRTVVVRRLDDGAVTWLAGTEHAQPPTWSPDSRSMAFLRDGELKVVDVATGGARTIGAVPADVGGGAWNHEGIILLGGSRLRRLSAADGHLTDVYRPGAGISRQFLPSFLPDGRTFLYAQDSSNAQQRGVFLGSLDSPTVTRLLAEPANAVISPRGYLLGHQGTVFARRFDLTTRLGRPGQPWSGADLGPNTASRRVTVVWSTFRRPRQPTGRSNGRILAARRSC
jgi:Tol biopolymer transport system component